MARVTIPILMVVAFLVGGCSFVSEALFPDYNEETATKPASPKIGPQSQQQSHRAKASLSDRQCRVVPQSTQTGQRRPLVVIHFEQRQVDYEQPLYYAMSIALKLHPNVYFDLESVAPSQKSIVQLIKAADVAHRNAQTVLSSILSMGLPGNRVSLSAGTSKDVCASEVRIFVREGHS